MLKAIIGDRRPTNRDPNQAKDDEENIESDSRVPSENDKMCIPLSPESPYTSSIQSDGFTILRNVLSEDECDEAVSLMWDFIEDTSSGLVNRSQPDTWYSMDSSGHPTWPCFRKIECDSEQSTFECNGAGWLLGGVREALAERVFKSLYGTHTLHCSKEGFALQRPTKKEISCNSETTKTTIINDGSSCSLDDHIYLRAFVSLDNTSTVNAEDSSTLSLGNGSKRISLLRGDVLLFRSDLILSIPSKSASIPYVQAQFLCTMEPANLTHSALLQRKTEAYMLRATGDHKPDQENWQRNHIVGSRHIRPFFRTSPPMITIRQAELYGLIPYTDDETVRHDELDRALLRGMRFLPEDKPTRPRTRLCDAHLEFLTANHCEEMAGQDKYLGGMPSPCGRYVYGVPGTSKRVMRIHCSTGHIDFIGPAFSGKFKWLRGVEVPSYVMDDARFPDGCCFALPCNAPCILKVNPHDSEVSTFGHNVLENCCTTNGWFYHGGNLAANGWVYAIPANAERVLKFHPVTEVCEMIGPNFGSGLQKWYGGIEGVDGCIYGIPHNERVVLKINPFTDEVSLMENKNCRTLPDGQWKWHGGLRAGNKIIGFPNNADDVLVIHVPDQRVYTCGMTDKKGIHLALQSGRHRIRKGNRYKYLGGSLTLDGRFAYLFPCDAEQVLRLNIETDELSLVGALLLDGPNKFQNGFTGRDGCLYGIPQRATGVLRIIPGYLGEEEDHVDIMDCGDIFGVKDKFEGGVMSHDGSIYCIPLRAKVCVKVVPAQV